MSGKLFAAMLAILAMAGLAATPGLAVTVSVTVESSGVPLPGATISFETETGVPITVTPVADKPRTEDKPARATPVDRVKTATDGTARAELPDIHKGDTVVVVVSKNDEVLIRRTVRDIWNRREITLTLPAGSNSRSDPGGQGDGGRE